MPDRGSRSKWALLASVRLRCGALSRAVTFVAVAAMLAGCAGTPPRIGEGGEFFTSPVWLPDGSSVLAYSSLHNRTVLFDVKSGASRVVDLKGMHSRPGTFSSDGKLIFNAFGASIQAWEASSGRQIWQWIGGGDNSIACVSGAEVVIPAKREVVLLDTAGGKVRAVLESEPYAGARGAVCSPDRRFLARTYSEGVVSIWDIAARRRIGLLRAWETGGPYPIALGPRAGQLAVWVNERVRLFGRDVSSGPGQVFPAEVARPDTEIDVGLQPVPQVHIQRGIEFSPDGRALALTGRVKASTSIFFFKLEQVLVNIEAKRVTRLPPEVGMDFAFSPDGSLLALAGSGVRIWDLRSGALVAYPKP